jgi:hypothetical protein
MHEELKEHTTFLGVHISGYVLLDELQAEDRQARVGSRLGDEVQQDFYQVEPELIIGELLVTILTNIVGCQNEVLMLHIRGVAIVLKDSHSKDFEQLQRAFLS